MALTRDFKETVAVRVQNDPAFAQALLDEAITLFVNGEPESAKLILRDLVNATVGFEALADEIHKPAKSLHRMLSKSGNPTMSNVSAIFAAIKRALKVEVRAQDVMACQTAEQLLVEQQPAGPSSPHVESLPTFSKPARQRWESIPAHVRQRLLSNVWCSHCGHEVTITDFSGTMKGRGLLLVGRCADCRSEVARVIEGA
jgi:DNA-binding phage protein